MTAKTAECVKVKGFHEANVQTMMCGECREEFPSIGFPDYCPCCAAEFVSTADLSDADQKENPNVPST